MKALLKYAGYVLAALLLIFAADCLLLHPVGRYQLHLSADHAPMRIDTTSRNVDWFNSTTGKWEHLEGKK